MKKNAFSLIEVLIAVTVFGIIASVVLVNTHAVINKTANSKLTYTAYTALRKGVGDYIAEKGQITSPSELCQALTESMNPIGDVDCTKDLTAPAGFFDVNVNFKLGNGMKFYNFGKLLSVDDEYFVVYVDIDGKNRHGVLNEDIVPFIINRYGEVLADGIAATDKNYLTAGYKYFNETSSTWLWAQKSLTFKDAICKSGLKLHTTTYCPTGSVDAVNCSSIPCEFHVIN